MPSLAAVLRPLSTRQRPDEPQSHGTTEAQGRLTPQPHARISSDIRPCFLFLVHPIASSASDEPFFHFPSAPRAHSLPTACPKAITPEHDRRNHRPKAPTFAPAKPHKITHLRGRRKQRAAIHTANPPFHTTPLQKFCPAVPAVYFCIVIKTATKYKSKNRRQ